MTRPLPLPTYSDCERQFAAALAAPRGLQLQCADPASAVLHRRRLHKYRVLLRAETSLYPPDHPWAGTSAYDRLLVQLSGPLVLIVPRPGPVEATPL